MELKREMFFDWETILDKNIINAVVQHPQEMEKILRYVFDEIQQLWEYMWKKTMLENDYHMSVHKLKEEYHIPLDK
jgi:hypothetical protein